MKDICYIRRRTKTKTRERLTERLPLRSGNFHPGQTGCIGISVFASMQMLLPSFRNKLRGLPSHNHLVCLSFQFWYTPCRPSCACARESEQLLPFRTAWISVLLFTLGIIVLECVIKRHVYLHTARITYAKSRNLVLNHVPAQNTEFWMIFFHL